MRILIFAGYFLPGFKAGGPVRTLANLVDHLGEEFELYVVTRNRDIGDVGSYSGIESNVWTNVGKCQVQYVKIDLFTIFKYMRVFREVSPDIVYLNSFFSPESTILPLCLRRLGYLSTVPFILAPRGEFSKGALQIKALKKKIYFFLANKIGLYSGLTWQVSSVYEKNDLLNFFNRDQNVVIAPNLPPKLSQPRSEVQKCTKSQGRVSVVFLSRISKMKNLLYALQVVRNCSENVDLNLYGPLEDAEYWSECEIIINDMPQNVTVKYHGEVDHDNVPLVLAKHDLFFLPTRGENFGHVILEALSAGCPVLLSDRTPWRQLEDKGIGWDFSLSEQERFTETIDMCAAMTEDDFAPWVSRAYQFSRQVVDDKEIVELSRRLFKETSYRKRSYDV